MERILMVSPAYSSTFPNRPAVLLTPGYGSLLRSIRDGIPTVTKGPEESTVSIDVEHVPLDGFAVTLFDCAGQVR